MSVDVSQRTERERQGRSERPESIWNRINPFHSHSHAHASHNHTQGQASAPTSFSGIVTGTGTGTGAGTGSGARPGSIWKKSSPLEVDDRRPVTALEKHQEVEEAEGDEDAGQKRFNTVNSPLPQQSSPNKPSRTPSILRTIAHRSSFSALRSRSKKKKASKSRPPLPPTLSFTPQHPHYQSRPGLGIVAGSDTGGHETHSGVDHADDFGPVIVANGSPPRGGTPGRNKLRKGSIKGLKGVKSVPRDLRLSHATSDKIESQVITPPLPTAYSAIPSRDSQDDTLGKPIYRRTRSPLRRKSVPVLTPSPARGRLSAPALSADEPVTPTRRYRAKPARSTPRSTRDVGEGLSTDVTPRKRYQEQVFAATPTPESVRIERMRLQFEVEVGGSPRRRRTASQSELEMESPKKIFPATLSPRHMSSPPSPAMMVTRTIPNHIPYNHPFTTSQHPHPVPLAFSPVESYTFAESTTFHHDFDPEPSDFLTLSQLSQRSKKSLSSPPTPERYRRPSPVTPRRSPRGSRGLSGKRKGMRGTSSTPPMSSVPAPADVADQWRAEDDFVPLTESGRTMSFDDGLDVLVQEEELPVGTPGGKQADLKRGALIDGERHERGAIRFFSRDMYNPMTPSPSPTPSPPSQRTSSEVEQTSEIKSESSDIPEQHSSPDQDTPEQGSGQNQTPFTSEPRAKSSNDSFRPTHGRRSSSPFEVKLTPVVTKRMSLDAFGTPEPLSQNSQISTNDPGPFDESAEEILENYEPSPRRGNQGGGRLSQDYRRSSLSTIKETPSSKSKDSETAHLSFTPGSLLGRTGQSIRTAYFTPFSPPSAYTPGTGETPANRSYGEIYSERPSISSPTRMRVKHRSAPVLPVNEDLLSRLLKAGDWPADKSSTPRKEIRELQASLRAKESALSKLKEELRQLKEEVEQREKDVSWDRMVRQNQELRELQELVAEKDEELEQLQRRIEDQTKTYEKNLDAQRATLVENEEFFETLQAAHDDLASRLSDLQAQHTRLCLERQNNAMTLVDVQNERDRLQAAVNKHRRTDDLAQVAISELQCSIVRAEKQLEAAEKDFAARDMALSEDFARLSSDLDIKQARVTELEDLLKDGLEREQELSKLKTRIAARDKQIERLEHVLDETREEAEILRRDADSKGIRLARLENQIQEVEEEKEVARKDLKAALRQNTAKDSIIGVLRDQLQTEAYAADEAKSAAQTELGKLQGEIQKLEGELGEKLLENKVYAEEVESMKVNIGELEAELAARDALERKAADEHKIQVSAVDQLVTGVERSLSEAEARVSVLELEKIEVEAKLARLDEERSKWQSEKQELQDAIVTANERNAEIERLHDDLDESEEALESARLDIDILHNEIQELGATSTTQQLMLTARDAEIERLRERLLRMEDDAANGVNASLRKSRNSESTIELLRSTITDLTAQLEAKDGALEEAFLKVEMERATAADVRSRSTSYLAEIDRLSLSEAGLRKEVEDVRKESAVIELKFEGMNKRLKTLEEDKGLLNVALDSKQTELTLLQRQIGVPPRSSNRDLSTSTTSTRGNGNRLRPRSVAETPTRERLTSSATSSVIVMTKRPSSVISSTLASSGAGKRDSWIPPTPTMSSTRVPSTPSRHGMITPIVGAGPSACTSRVPSTPTTIKATGRTKTNSVSMTSSNTQARAAQLGRSTSAVALGESTRFNRVQSQGSISPSKKHESASLVGLGVKGKPAQGEGEQTVGVGAGVTGGQRAGAAGLQRQSSLPVLKVKKSGELGRSRTGPGARPRPPSVIE